MCLILAGSICTQAHAAKAKVEMVAYEKYDEPRMEEVLSVAPNRKELGKTFKKDQKAIVEHFETLCEADLLEHKVGTLWCTLPSL